MRRQGTAVFLHNISSFWDFDTIVVETQDWSRHEIIEEMFAQFWAGDDIAYLVTQVLKVGMWSCSPDRRVAWFGLLDQKGGPRPRGWIFVGLDLALIHTLLSEVM